MRASRYPRPAATALVLLCSLLTCNLLAIASAAEKPAADASPAAQYQALSKEFQQAQEDFYKVYQAAKTDEERGKIAATRPQSRKYAVRFLELAQKAPQDPAAFDALVWLVSYVRFGAEAEKAMSMLLKDHLQSAKLGPICQNLAFSPSPQAEQQLREIMAKNPHPEVQGQAMFSLAKVLQSQPGKTKEAEDYFEQIIKKFADVKGDLSSLAGEAKSALFEIRSLSPGQPVPEIEGQDVEGKAFKLSEDRGKVVLIDFWGDW